MTDELFSPTIRDRPDPGPAPWRPESILYPAFFGGPLAAATLGVLNGRRLRLPVEQLVAIGAAGVAAFAARVTVTSMIDGNSGARFVGAVAGLAVWLLVLALQRRQFRIFVYGNGEPRSLVWPGLAAAICGGVFEAIMIFWLAR